MIKKVFLALNGLSLIGALLVTIFVLRSQFAIASRFAEFDRAGCVNQSSLISYSVNRFNPDDRKSVAEWIAKPASESSYLAVFVLGITIASNLAIGAFVLLRKPLL